MNHQKSENRKTQLLFFLTVYGSPFITFFAVQVWLVFFVREVSLVWLFIYAFTITGVHAGIILTYRLAQPSLQRWRIYRAVRQQAINSRTASKPSVSSSS
jgi:uncharacterized membrane protein